MPGVTSLQHILRAYSWLRLQEWKGPLVSQKEPASWSDPDGSNLGVALPAGAPGTYSHLTDAVLRVSATRAMYMRRLRTLMDVYFKGGRLRQARGEKPACTMWQVSGCLYALTVVCCTSCTDRCSWRC